MDALARLFPALQGSLPSWEKRKAGKIYVNLRI